MKNISKIITTLMIIGYLTSCAEDGVNQSEIIDPAKVEQVKHISANEIINRVIVSHFQKVNGSSTFYYDNHMINDQKDLIFKA